MKDAVRIMDRRSHDAVMGGEVMANEGDYTLSSGNRRTNLQPCSYFWAIFIWCCEESSNDWSVL
jgi:hypothetical protein